MHDIKAYKFRGIKDVDILKRDLNTFSNNTFFASTFEMMNDPFEANFDEIISETTTIIGEKFKTDSSDVKQSLLQILAFKDKLGVYCLSKTYLNEILWTFYADDHRGYCIEYNIDKLQDHSQNSDFAFPIDVLYTNEKPLVTLFDINSNSISQKMFGTKRKKWDYEEEVRIIFDGSGLKKHHSSAITGIYFGYRADSALVNDVCNLFQNRDVVFYKMKVDLQSHNLKVEVVKTHHRSIYYNLSKYDFHLVKTFDLYAITRYYIFVPEKYNDFELRDLALAFKEKYAYKTCNIFFVNNKTVVDLHEKIKSDEEYLFFAESIIGELTGLDDIFYPYPFKDYRYEGIINQK